MLKNFIRILGGDPNKRAIDQTTQTADQINALEPQFEQLSDEALRSKTAEFRARLAQALHGITDEKERQRREQQALDELLPEAFAAVREASKRSLGQRHYDVQLLGGITLHQGKISEMRTGEGKTLVATLPLYLNALTGRGAHLITVNDYLARRDARWMAPIFTTLGLTVGVLQMAARTENGKKAFLVDFEKESPHEDQHHLRMVLRREAYAADITYGTNSEFGFDYLRDNMGYSLTDRVQRGHYYAIVDEVDNVLIDEARTPLIISGPASENTEWYVRMTQIVRQLRPEDYEISERDNNITLTEMGEVHVEELLGQPLRDPERPEDITHEQARLLGYLEQALRAHHLFKKNKDYIVQAGKVVIVDEFTGRLMPGRRWSDGLHQSVEAKEGVRVEPENVTYATITIQNYFRMYQKLAGMSGTALTEAEEFNKIYKLDVLPIPTNLEYSAARSDSDLAEVEERDEQGYKYRYFARKNDTQKTPIYWRRKDYPDVIYRSEEAKFRALCSEIMRYHAQGRPILVGTTSVDLSERLSARLRREPLQRLAQVLLLRSVWLEQNKREEDGRLIDDLAFMNLPLDKLDTSEMRRMARDLGISFNPEEPSNRQRLLILLDLSPLEDDRLTAVLEGGVPHQVLNARKHTEESLIIAGAGAFGAVTIATNMAGRGVDIKLGGELADEIIAAVNRVLRKGGYTDPYDMTHVARREALLQLAPEDYGVYETEVKYFLQYLDEMEAVRRLGGLHVIGSERHEARRIDNQLRGRAARQGDPGSSRFYLSLEDELMRRFGGQQADAMMKRLKIDDAVPMEFGVVSRIVESSQTRVEGANFDVRKHLLEYDDVLNQQRAAIYSQRDRVFTKDDLHDDVTEMLRAEVARRVQEIRQPAPRSRQGSQTEDWKLLAWLEQIQPTRYYGKTVVPSYPLKLLIEQISSQQPATSGHKEILAALLKLAENALLAEEEHLLEALDNLLEQAQDRLETQTRERLETLDNYFDNLNLDGSEGEAPKTAREVAEELTSLLQIPLRISNEEFRALKADPRQFKKTIRSTTEAALTSQSAARLIGAVERRIEEPLELDPARLPLDDAYALSEQIAERVQTVLARRRQRLVGDEDANAEGQIARDLQNAVARIQGSLTDEDIVALLMIMPEGARTAFDKKTHRRVWQRTTRLSFAYYTAQLIETCSAEELTESILQHLEEAQLSMRSAWGQAEWTRLSPVRLADLPASMQNGLRLALGDEAFARAQDAPLHNLPPDEASLATAELGRQALTEIYRQLLLGVITELWVDYLTQMEGLRVSVGLEAYGQRDPLVQYKSKAFELFQTLIINTRQGVTARMFNARTRELAAMLSAAPGPGAPRIDSQAASAGEDTTSEKDDDMPEAGDTETDSLPEHSTADKKKRRRRR